MSRISARWPVTVLAAVAGGAATALAFAPVHVVAFAILGPALGLWAFAQARTGRRGAVSGLAYGLAFAYTAYIWMLELDLIAYIVLSLLQAGFWALTGAVTARISHLRPGWWVAGVTATWTLVEALRARGPATGFEWGQLGLSTADTVLRRGAAIVGTLGMTALLVAIAAGLAALAMDRRLRSVVSLAVSTVALVAVVVLGSFMWTTPGETLEVAVVQADSPCPDSFAEECPDHSDRLLTNYVAEMATLTSTPDLVVLGEDALPAGETLDAVGQDFVERFGPLPAPLLAGSATPAEPGRFFRQAALFDRDGTSLGAYAKREPVPFGEYVPFRSLLGGVSDVGRLVPTDIMPGRDTSPVTLPTASDPALLGTVVSWEVTFSRLVHDVARHANGLATLTTVSSYGRSAAPEQLLDAAQLRAAEHQKPMVVGATTGPSAIILPTGEMSAKTALLRADSTTGSMPLRNGLTPFGRTGDLAVTAIAAMALLLVIQRARREDRTAGVREQSPPPATDSEPVDSTV